MCTQFVYCPRLFHYEHVQGIFVESSDTIEGRAQHDRAAKRGGKKKKKKDQEDTKENASLLDSLPPIRTALLASEVWGVRGKLDFVEEEDDEIVAVEYKRGKGPPTAEHLWRDIAVPYAAWPGDVAQLGLYMALLRESGLPCERGRIFYRENRVDTTIPWSEDLAHFLRSVVAAARTTCQSPTIPAPLEDDRKCVGCSLNEVCLPDEIRAINREIAQEDIRRIIPGRDDRAVVHVVSPGTTMRKDGDGLMICTRDGEKRRVLTKDVAHVAMFGATHITRPCLVHLLERGITTSHHTGAGRMLGITMPLQTRNIVIRRAQFAAAEDVERTLAVAKSLVVAKIRNQRTVIRRYRRGVQATCDAEDGRELPEWAGGNDPSEEAEQTESSMVCDAALKRMKIALRAAGDCTDIAKLRGHEGDAAARFFSVLPAILPKAWKTDFCGRSRRPPRDRVNALLSFAYSLLLRDTVSALGCVGLDPMLGYLHVLVPGRPALGLDLMEPFRPAWVDTAVLRLLATGGIGRSDFHMASTGVTLTSSGRNALIRAYERRADELTTHPRFGYRMSYRRMLELEARMLAKWLIGEIEEFSPLWTR